MRLLKRYNEGEGAGARTVYVIAGDDRKETVVTRNHFPTLIGNKIWNVQGADMRSETARKALGFVQRNAPREDLMCPVLVRKVRGAFAPVQDGCWSLEQAVFLARQTLDACRKGTGILEELYIKSGEILIKDFLNEPAALKPEEKEEKE